MTHAKAAGGTLLSGGPPARRSTTTATPLCPRDVTDLAEIVARSAASREPLRIVASGTWLDAGRAVSPHATALDLSGLSGIVEYVPGDLTLTALAGTPLAVIADATAVHGQWLSLDPFGAPHGSLGATLATASPGPLAATIGRPRDVALGIEFVSGEGTRIRGGGRVVKNVAGFDFVRLQVGAWGSLGVLAEATVRLRGRPEVDRTIALRVPRDDTALATIAAGVRAQRVPPLAAELLNARLATAIGLGDDDVILFRLAGNEDAVAAQASMVAALGEHADFPLAVWTALAQVEPPEATVIRLSALPASIATTWADAQRAPGASEALRHASLGRGTVRIISTVGVDGAADLVFTSRWGAHGVVERTLAGARGGLPSVASDRLSTRLRAAFDPHGILNPGIMGRA